MKFSNRIVSIFIFSNIFLCVGFCLVLKTNADIFGELKDSNQKIENLLVEVQKVKAETDKNAENISFLDFSMKSSEKMRAKIEQVKTIIKDDIVKKRYNCNLSNVDIYNVASAVVRYSERYGTSIALILSVIRQESSFNSKAVSKAGAQGLMQIMPETVKECALELNKKDHEYNVFNVSDNIQFGVFYLSKMIHVFNKDISWAVKAYNAGPVFIKKFQSQEDGFLVLPNETVKYHENVMKYYSDYQTRGL
jgi:soluble lytic murein transglycosylase-like protein